MGNQKRPALAVAASIGMTVVLCTTPAFADSAVSSGMGSGSGSGSTGTVTSYGPLANGQPTTKISSATAIMTVETLFPFVGNVTTAPTATLQQDPLNANHWVYQINWNSFAISRANGPMLTNNGGIDASVDANTGQVLTFQDFGTDWLSTGPLSVASALQRAKDWLQKLAPAESGQVVLVPSSGFQGGQYVYLFMPKVNGAWVSFDRILITLNGSGQLTYYSYQWPKESIPALPSNIISLHQATSKYRDNLRLSLQYQSTYNQYGMGPVQLAYQPAPSNGIEAPPLPVISAVSGKAVGLDGKPIQQTTSTPLRPLVAGGPTAWPHASAQVESQSLVERVIRQQFGFSSKSWTLDSVVPVTMHGGPFNNHPTLQLRFTGTSSNEQVEVDIDATDGVVTQYTAFNPGVAASPGSITPPSKSQLEAAADKFVEDAFPNLSGAIARIPQGQIYGSPNQTAFNYAFLVHGIDLSAMNVIIDNATGRVVNYFLQVDPSATYPSPVNAISTQSALQAYLQQYPVTLQYQLPQNTTITNSGPIQTTYGKAPELVYTAGPLPYGPGTLNALTGQWQSPYQFGNVSISTKPGVTVVDMAMAELQDHGVIRMSDSATKPDSVISRAQFIQWLARAYNYNISSTPAPQFPDVSPTSPYAAEVSEALSQGWLPGNGKLIPEQPLTRVQVATWLIDWMGWQGPASDSSLYKIPFTDASAVPKADLAAAAILAGEKIMPLEHGKFQPNATMTVGDAAVVLYNAIKTLLRIDH